MLLFAGLGNPRPGDAGNRHNIGFMALDRIVRRHGFGPWRARFRGYLAEGGIAGVKILALKPMTYMNLSGEAIGEAAHFYKLAPSQVVVFHDELELTPGKVKVKQGGGSAGHNGLRSIDQLFDRDYKRVRLGIGHPGDKNLVHPYVLRDFDKEEQPWLEKLLDALADAAPLLVAGDDSEFMNRCHLALHPPRPKPPRTDVQRSDGSTSDRDPSPSREDAGPSLSRSAGSGRSRTGPPVPDAAPEGSGAAVPDGAERKRGG